MNDYKDNYFLENNLSVQNTPVIFTDGTYVYDKLEQKYITPEKVFLFMDLAALEKHITLNSKKRIIWIDGGFIGNM